MKVMKVDDVVIAEPAVIVQKRWEVHHARRRWGGCLVVDDDEMSGNKWSIDNPTDLSIFHLITTVVVLVFLSMVFALCFITIINFVAFIVLLSQEFSRIHKFIH